MTRNLLRRVLCLISVAIVIAGAWSPQLDLLAKDRLSVGLERALATYAMARSLNAILSVVQDTTISVQPMGVGVTLAPAQLLHPINHLLDQFSDVMLAASISIGIQQVLVAIGGHPVVAWLLTLSLAMTAFVYMSRQDTPVWLRRVVIVLVLIRFAMPLVVLGSERLFETFLSNEYEASRLAVSKSKPDIKEAMPMSASPKQDESLTERLKRWSEGVSKGSSDLKRGVEELASKLEDTANHLVRLCVVFVLQTVLLPLILLWIGYVLVRAAIMSPAAAWGGPSRRDRLAALSSEG